MLVFFDTEFTDLHRDAKLVSIGLVSEGGDRSFYAELSDAYEPNECGDFTRETVLPLLEGGAALMTMDEVSLRVGDWIKGFRQPMKLATDSLEWDWPWIQKLFTAPQAWLTNLDSKPEILLFDADVGEKFNDALERAFAGGLRQHHALDDAKANRFAWIAAGGARCMR